MDEEIEARLKFLEDRIRNLLAHQLINEVSIATLRSLVALVAKEAGPEELKGGKIDDVYFRARNEAVNAILARMSDTDPTLATALREQMKQKKIF